MMGSYFTENRKDVIDRSLQDLADEAGGSWRDDMGYICFNDGLLPLQLDENQPAMNTIRKIEWQKWRWVRSVTFTDH